MMMTQLSSYLDELKAATQRAAAAEDEFRQSIAVRTRALERERAFAFRRLNLMRAIAEAIASAESEEIAVAGATAILRVRLGWSSDSDARTEVLSRFVPVARTMFSHLAPEQSEPKPLDVGKALADFESWYAACHPGPFWL